MIATIVDDNNKENINVNINQGRPVSLSRGTGLLHDIKPDPKSVSNVKCAEIAPRQVETPFDHGLDVLNQILSGHSTGNGTIDSNELHQQIDELTKAAAHPVENNSSHSRRVSLHRDQPTRDINMPENMDSTRSNSSQNTVDVNNDNPNKVAAESIQSAVTPQATSIDDCESIDNDNVSDTDSVTTDGSLASVSSTHSSTVSTVSSSSSRRSRRSKDSEHPVSRQRYMELKIENTALKRELNMCKVQHDKEMRSISRYRQRAKQKMEKLELRAKDANRLKSELFNLKRELDELRVAKANAELEAGKRRMHEELERRTTADQVNGIRTKLKDLYQRFKSADIQTLHAKLCSQFQQQQEPGSLRIVEEELDWSRLTLSANQMLDSIIQEASSMYEEMMSHEEVRQLHMKPEPPGYDASRDPETDGIIITAHSGHSSSNRIKTTPSELAQVMYIASLSTQGLIISAKKQQDLNIMTAEHVGRIQRKHELFMRSHGTIKNAPVNTGRTSFWKRLFRR